MNQFLYVLVSKPEDYYYEQLLISVTSLRKHNPNAFVTVLVDNRTNETLCGSLRGRIKDLVQNIVVVDFDDNLNNTKRSRYLKTTMREHIQGDFLFVDCDTVICDHISLDDFDIEFGAVYDGNSPWSYHNIQRTECNTMADKGYIIPKEDYYNSGVIWCKDTETTHEFYKRWHELYLECNKVGIGEDQPSFNITNQEMGGPLQRLDNTWNCVAMLGGVSSLSKCKILHYAAYKHDSDPNAHPYILGDRKVIDEVKRSNHLTQAVLDVIDDPRGAFYPSAIVAFGSNRYHVYKSSIFSALNRLYEKQPRFFGAIDSFLGKIRKRKQNKQYRERLKNQ